MDNNDRRNSAHPGVSPQRWALWRLDDNGNRFLMETYDSRERAEAAAREYTARGHKQTYWVEPG